MYSKLLYMGRSERKHRVTFRVAPDLAAALRQLPNQTAFVEEALRGALGRACPVCGGRGRISATRLRVSDFKRAALPKLKRAQALRLREVVRLGRRLCATELVLSSVDRGLGFRLARKSDVLLRGRIQGDVTLEN